MMDPKTISKNDQNQYKYQIDHHHVTYNQTHKTIKLNKNFATVQIYNMQIIITQKLSKG